MAHKPNTVSIELNGSVMHLDTGTYVLGRPSQGHVPDIPLEGDRISRKQAVLTITERYAHIHNTGKARLTVNGKAAIKKRLKRSCIIACGSNKVRLIMDSEHLRGPRSHLLTAALILFVLIAGAAIFHVPDDRSTGAHAAETGPSEGALKVRIALSDSALTRARWHYEAGTALYRERDYDPGNRSRALQQLRAAGAILARSLKPRPLADSVHALRTLAQKELDSLVEAHAHHVSVAMKKLRATRSAQYARTVETDLTAIMDIVADKTDERYRKAETMLHALHDQLDRRQ